MEDDNMESRLTGPESHYFQQLDRGVFEIQRCSACERHQFFPRVLCAHCGDENLHWVRPSGQGSVYSYSIVRRKSEAGGDYNVVLVDLDEGVRLMSRVEGVEPADIRIGQRVTAHVVQEDGKGVLVFGITETSDA